MLIVSLNKNRGKACKSILLLLSFLLVFGIFIMGFQPIKKTNLASLCTCSGHPSAPRCDECEDYEHKQVKLGSLFHVSLHIEHNNVTSYYSLLLN
jgi:hypothetical protein